jgi:mono/diheme cytochrome c family protein
LREGVSRDGSHLFPAFPYTHFTKLSDDDVAALYAYFMTRPPVVSATRPNTLRFPFNVRALQAAWKLLYFERGRYEAQPGHSPVWNRGAYLAEGITHCAACHTPRNAAGAERRDAPYAGAPFDGWLAPALSAANPAPLPWTQRDLADYLRRGESESHGAAAGAMAAVVHQGLAALPDADVQALATYFADRNDSASRQRGTAPALSRAMARRLVDIGRETEPGANLYASACASCHFSPAPLPGTVSGSLALSTALTSDDPSNFILTVMEGLGGGSTPGPYMPGFAASLTDTDIANLGAYLRHTRTDLPPWPALAAAVASKRPHTPTLP